MKKKHAFYLAVVISLFVLPICFMPVENVTAAEPWLAGFQFRRLVTITGQSGAGVNYQVLVNVTWDSDMQYNFNDVRFTDNDKTTELSYWRQNYTAGSFALFWVKVSDNLNTDVEIYEYYGNSIVSTTSNGFDTFIKFLDKTNITGWTTQDMTVTTSGDFLRFYNPTAGNNGGAERFDLLTNTPNFACMAQLKTVSLGDLDQGVVVLMQDSLSDRVSQVTHPKGTDGAGPHYIYYNDGTTTAFANWTEGNEFIVEVHVNGTSFPIPEIDYVNHRLYNTAWKLLGSALDKSVTLGNPDYVNGLRISDSPLYNLDVYFRFIAFRKRINTEPSVSDIGEETSDWYLIKSTTVAFVVTISEQTLWAYHSFILLVGLAMIPFSTIYLAWGGRKSMTVEKLFLGLIIFFLGWGLVVGVIIVD